MVMRKRRGRKEKELSKSKNCECNHMIEQPYGIASNPDWRRFQLHVDVQVNFHKLKGHIDVVRGLKEESSSNLCR